MPRKLRKAPPPDPMSIAEVADRWRVSTKSVQRWINIEHRFPGAFRVGRQWRIPLADVEAYEAEALKRRRNR